VYKVVMDVHGHLVLSNQEARTMFGIVPQDVGRPFYELELSYRPVELRSRIEQVYSELRAQHLTNIERTLPEGRTQCLDVHLVPLVDPDSTPLGISITFYDVTPHRRLQTELEKSRQELE